MSTSFPTLTILHPIVLAYSDRKAVSRISLPGIQALSYKHISKKQHFTDMFEIITDHNLTLQTVLSNYIYSNI